MVFGCMIGLLLGLSGEKEMSGERKTPQDITTIKIQGSPVRFDDRPMIDDGTAKEIWIAKVVDSVKTQGAEALRSISKPAADIIRSRKTTKNPVDVFSAMVIDGAIVQSGALDPARPDIADLVKSEIESLRAPRGVQNLKLQMEVASNCLAQNLETELCPLDYVLL